MLCHQRTLAFSGNVQLEQIPASTNQQTKVQSTWRLAAANMLQQCKRYIIPRSPRPKSASFDFESVMQSDGVSTFSTFFPSNPQTRCLFSNNFIYQIHDNDSLPRIKLHNLVISHSFQSPSQLCSYFSFKRGGVCKKKLRAAAIS